MSGLIDETGSVYSRLTVLRRATEEEMSESQRRRSYACWLCQCECGNKTVVSGGNLRSGNTQSCGCLASETAVKNGGRYFIDEVDNQYGRLTVLRRATEKEMNESQIHRNHIHWVCQCECGNTTVVPGTRLRGGHTKSCGCLHLEKSMQNLQSMHAWIEEHGHPTQLPKGVAMMHTLLLQYKHAAKARELSWGLTETQFKELTQQPCHYCGAEPAQVLSRPCTNGGYIYNGIDRIDNNKGYIIDNVVPCCGDCNRAKSVMPYNEFLTLVKRVYEHLGLG